MPLTGVDIAWAQPSISDIKSTGATFVARYFSPDSTKNLTAAEVRDYPANGLSVVVVFESSSNRMLGGSAAGVADAQAAELQRRAVGLPDDAVIYFACDFDVQGSQFNAVNSYMRGVNSVIGLGRSGFYGGYFAVENVAASPATASYFWQADAWSNGQWSSHANIRQDGGTALSGGADVDHSETADFGQYPRPTQYVSTAPSAPHSNGDEDDVAITTGSVPQGFASDIKGNEIDRSRSLSISLPPQNGGAAGWGGVWLSFAADFATVRLRVAVLNSAGIYRINFFDVGGQGKPGRISVPIFDGDQSLSVGRVQGFGDGTEPVGYLVEAVRK
ncbi:glycoside hydrolase domain-containing protein [Kitasatospora mediocidica]|uniref:glycoside hydrolase domain-containing protein n=1 Tax=Kitasatospora mediocidica TaxID=58352 RepID=UPI000A05D9F6|nr:glycoside hydrolase domain-containing protein [Kitasatospora mediocidica]